MIESLLSSNTSNRFKFIVIQPVGKTCDLRHRNGTMIHKYRKSKDCRQHALVTCTKKALKVGSLLLLRVRRLE